MASEELAKYRNIVSETAGGFRPEAILSHIRDFDRDGLNIEIPVNQLFIGGIHIDSITMHVGLVPDEDDSEFFSDGDLGVNYSLDPNWKGDDPDEPAMDYNDAMEFLYRGGFDEELRDILVKAGFSSDSASDVTGSESGMQDEGRASYDTGEIGDEVRKAILTTSNRGVEGAVLSFFKINPADPKLEQRKNEILKMFLTKIKDENGVPFSVHVAVRAMINVGIKWPELEIIMRSAEA